MNIRFLISALILGFGAYSALTGSVDRQSDLPSAPLPDTENCSDESEGLKICTSSSPMDVRAGDKVVLKITWKNSSAVSHRLFSPSVFSVNVKNSKGEVVKPYAGREVGTKASTKTSDEKIKELGTGITAGGYKGEDLEAGTLKEYAVHLTEGYGYDFDAAGKYFVTLTRTMKSWETGTELAFVIENIEVDVD